MRTFATRPPFLRVIRTIAGTTGDASARFMSMANATAVAEKKAAKAEDEAAMAADAAAAPLDPEGNVAPAPQDPLDDAAYPDLIPEAAAAEAAEREAFLHATRQAAALGLPPLGAWW